MTDGSGERSVSMPVGVVVRRSPGVTQWARWSWRAVAALPGAGPADWRELRRETTDRGEVTDYHAATLTLELHRAETESYLEMLNGAPPSLWVVMRPDAAALERPPKVHLVTASPHEAQDYLDSGEELVEGVPAPEGVVAWVRTFVEAQHVETPFKKRRRDRARTDRVEDGVGDPRIRQRADVYRAPAALKPLRNGAASPAGGGGEGRRGGRRSDEEDAS